MKISNGKCRTYSYHPKSLSHHHVKRRQDRRKLRLNIVSLLLAYLGWQSNAQHRLVNYYCFTESRPSSFLNFLIVQILLTRLPTLLPEMVLSLNPESVKMKLEIPSSIFSVLEIPTMLTISTGSRISEREKVSLLNMMNLSDSPFNTQGLEGWLLTYTFFFLPSFKLLAWMDG